MGRVMLAMAVVHPALWLRRRRPGMALRYGLNLPSTHSSLSNNKNATFLPLCLLVASEMCSTKYLPVALLSDALWIIFKGTYKNVSSETTPQPSPHPRQFRVVCRFYTLSLELGPPPGETGSRHFFQISEVANFSVSLVASVCLPVDTPVYLLMCQQVMLINCTSASTVSPWVPWNVWGASSGGIQRCVDYCCQDCVVWNNHQHKFYMHKWFPFYMSGKYL